MDEKKKTDDCRFNDNLIDILRKMKEDIDNIGKENRMNEYSQVKMNITGYGGNQVCEAQHQARESRNSQIEAALARLQNKIGEFSTFIDSCTSGPPAKLYDSPQGSPPRQNRPLFDLLDSIPDELNKASAELGEIISTLRARLM